MSWQDRAACTGMATLVFFGPDDETQPERQARERQAKAACAFCSARAECLDYALRHSVRHGIWGGLNEKERSPGRRRRSRKASAA